MKPAKLTKRRSAKYLSSKSRNYSDNDGYVCLGRLEKGLTGLYISTVWGGLGFGELIDSEREK